MGAGAASHSPPAHSPRPAPGVLARRRRPRWSLVAGRSRSLTEVRSAGDPGEAAARPVLTGPGRGVAGECPRLLRGRRSTLAAPQPAFPAPAPRPLGCLCWESAGGGLLREKWRSGSWAGGGSARAQTLASATLGPESGKGPVGPSILGALLSHRRLVDVKVSCLHGRSGDFRRQGASVEDGLEKNLKQENSLDFWRCVEMGVGGQQPLTADPNWGGY